MKALFIASCVLVGISVICLVVTAAIIVQTERRLAKADHELALVIGQANSLGDTQEQQFELLWEFWHDINDEVTVLSSYYEGLLGRVEAMQK